MARGLVWLVTAASVMAGHSPLFHLGDSLQRDGVGQAVAAEEQERRQTR